MPSNMDDASYPNAAGDGPTAPGYETRDANTRAVLGFLVFLFVVLALILFGTWRLFRHYSVVEQQPASPSAFADMRQVPSGPELEVDARGDLLKTFAKQQQELESYSWEDRKAGVVRIPIERAMDLLVQKGLPVVSSTTEYEAAHEHAALKNPKRAEGVPDAALPEGTP